MTAGHIARKSDVWRILNESGIEHVGRVDDSQTRIYVLAVVSDLGGIEDIRAIFFDRKTVENIFAIRDDCERKITISRHMHRESKVAIVCSAPIK